MNAVKNLRLRRGFTLVEMAVVLVIIGLILGAVMVGKDVQRNAEYTKIKQKFVDQWVVSYNTYYQRTGVPVGDDQTNPRLMVNGLNYVAAAGTPTSGGNMAGVALLDAVCHGAAGPGMTHSYAPGTGVGTDPDLRLLMQQAGVGMPPGRAVGQEDRYVYLDTNGNPQEIQVCFQWNAPGVGTNGEGSGNVMVLTGLTPDLARALDQMIDGKADAQEGVFRQQGVANGTANAPGVAWAGNNTYVNGATGATAAGTGTNLDEDQVQTVVAIYKMNQ